MMRNTFLSLVVILTATAGICSARTPGSGHIITQNRPIADVQGVELAGIGDLIITQGGSESLVIEAEDNIAPLIETSVTKGQLRISVKNGETLAPTKPVLIKLAVKNLNKITLSGSGDIDANKLSSPNPLDVRLPGSGDIDLAGLDCPSLSFTLSGSGDATFAGKAKEQSIEIAGSGDCDAKQLQGETAKVTIKGSGSCDVSASNKLDAEIAGSGKIAYRGAPAVTKRITGSGSIHQASDKNED